MNTKTSVVFGIIAVAAAVLLFAAGPIVSTHQALAWGGGWGGGFGGFGGFGGCCGCFSCCGCCGFGGFGF
jgi:hypothetical protein